MGMYSVNLRQNCRFRTRACTELLEPRLLLSGLALDESSHLGGESSATTVAGNEVANSVTLDGRLTPSMVAQFVYSGTQQIEVQVESDGLATPGGTVQFWEDGKLLLETFLGATGTAVMPVIDPPPGPRTFKISYLGNDQFAPVETLASVNYEASSTELTIDRSGETMWAFAYVVRQAYATGELSYFLDGILLSIEQINTNYGSLQLPSLAAGTHVISAKYHGGSFTAPSSDSVTVKSTSISLVPTTGAYPTTITARATSSDGTPLTGSIYVTIAGRPDLGNVALDASGQATISLVAWRAGTYTLTARYAEEPLLAGSSKAITVNVLPSPTTTTLSITEVNGVPTARVVVAFDPRSLKGTSTVSILIDGTLHVRGSLSTAGVFAGSLPPLPAGAHRITAQYSGSVYTATSAASMDIFVNAAATTTNIQRIDAVGALVQVSAAASRPTGTILLWVDDALLGASDFANPSFNTSNLAPGLHRAYAQYLGVAGRWLPSQSAVVEFAVRRESGLTFALSAATINPGGQLSIAAVVSGSGPIHPSGLIEIYAGSALLGSASLDAGRMTIEVSPRGVGDISLDLKYGGDSLFAPASQTATIHIARGPIVDVLFLYNSAANDIYGGAASAVASIISRTNTILGDSYVAAEVRSAGFLSVDYSEATRLSTDLSRMADSDDGYLDNIDSLRDEYGADVVCLLVGDSDQVTAGIAYTPSSRDALRDTDTPFMVMEMQYYASTVFAHEFGHIFGAKHDYDSSERVIASDAFGYSFSIGSQRYTDLLSYEDGIRLPYYSNPDVLYNGVPVGRAGRANVARVISEGAPVVAGYRASKQTNSVTSLSLSASASYAHSGQTITMTAAGPSSGQVEFYNGADYLGATDLQRGIATQTVTLTGHGTQLIYAKYKSYANGDIGSISNVLPVVLSETELLANGVLNIAGTPLADSISTTIRDGMIDVNVNGQITTHVLSAIRFAVVTADAGDDIIDLRNITVPSTIMGGAGNDIVIGTSAGDSVNAGPGNDTVYANAGDDSIDGGEGMDLLYGQWGNDTVLGGPGADAIYGEDGDDLLYGGDANDTIAGQLGRDTIYGNFGDDSIAGGADADSLMGGLGADTMGGGAADDSLWGGDQSDLLKGGLGNDYLEGKGKADAITGGAGNDTIRGQAGEDLIHGGDGDDFIYVDDAFHDTVYAGPGKDSVAFDPLDTILEHEVDLLA